MLDAVGLLLIVCGAVFFLAGTVGLLRFPDVHARLHAVTKADNLGLGLTVLGLAVRADGVGDALRLLAIWAVALAASATACYLIAGHARRRPAEHRG